LLAHGVAQARAALNAASADRDNVYAASLVAAIAKAKSRLEYAQS